MHIYHVVSVLEVVRLFPYNSVTIIIHILSKTTEIHAFFIQSSQIIRSQFGRWRNANAGTVPSHTRFIPHISHFRIQSQAVIQYHLVWVTASLINCRQQTFMVGSWEFLFVCPFVLFNHQLLSLFPKGLLALVDMLTYSPLSGDLFFTIIDEFCEAPSGKWVGLL
jgi:hypothetical protein